MIDESALRLWAYQWVTRGNPELPDGWQLFVIDRGAKDIIEYSPQETPFDGDRITLRRFVVESQDSISTCRVGHSERHKVFVVTPVETLPRYDLATQDALA